ncbi:T9SS type A sorting domain-containing protein [candidate division KSB1 bacterium]|nr:T9SS type A sorting domain-containing protein [candidate division KSB1 bacterium]
MKRLFISVLLLPIAVYAAISDPAAGRGPVRRRALDVANPNIENAVIRNGRLDLNITNFGYIGNSDPSQDALTDPCPPGGWAESLEYPPGSGVHYLYQAALWFGAEIVEGPDSLTPRVSVGVDGWLNPSVNEFWPGEGEQHGIRWRSNIPGAVNCFGEDIFDPAARAHLEAIAVYADTLTEDYWLVDDPVDGPHRPLGVEVTQSILGWTSPQFADFLLLEFRVRNIGTNVLRNPALGLYCDSDVGYYDLFNEHTDDLTGFLLTDTLTGDTVNIGYVADNDGRRSASHSGPIGIPAAIGISGWSRDNADAVTGYNWWMSNGDLTYDFAPGWLAHPDSGTPMGDLAKYRFLDGGEQDYDQVLNCDLAYRQSHPQLYREPCTPELLSQAWRSEVNENCADIVNGYDTRFLLSLDPVGVFDYIDPAGACVYRLNPGEEFTVTFALLMGPGFHDPEHPQVDPLYIDPTLYDFTGLLRTYRTARMMWDSNYSYQPPRPVANLRPVGNDATQVHLVWSAAAGEHIVGYNVVRVWNDSLASPLTPSPIPGLEFTATGLQLGEDVLLAVEAVDDSGYSSAREDTLVRVGAALPVTGITAHAFGDGIRVSWNASNDPLVISYQIMRISAADDTMRSTLPATQTAFDDEILISGREYRYRLFALNSRGLTSLPSSQASAIAWHPEHRILLIDETDPANLNDLNLTGGIADTLVDAAYREIMETLNLPFDTLQQHESASIRYSLETLANYDLVIWHSEDNRNLTNYPLAVARAEVLRQYLEHNGRLLRLGRRIFTTHALQVGRLRSEFDFHWLLPLNFDSLQVWNRWSPQSQSLQFVGATSTLTSFPDIAIDATKVQSLRWRGNSLDYLPEIDLMWPRWPGVPLYRSVVLPTDSSGLGNQPVGIIAPGQILLSFPLYFLQAEDARELLSACIDTLRSMLAVEPPVPPVSLPQSLVLHPCFPNPFNPETTIRFELPTAELATVELYNMLGQRVATLMNRPLPAGMQELKWSGVDDHGSIVGSGIYFVRLSTIHGVATQKLLLMR